MPVYETFSKRQKRLAGQDVPTLYIFDNLPKPFRVQVCHILDDPIGELTYEAESLWWHAEKTLAREFGVHELGVPGSAGPFGKCKSHILTGSTEQVLDIIEFVFHNLSTLKLTKVNARHFKEAVEELNLRFREHSIGYQFAGGQIIKVDSQYLHAEAVEPALGLLHSQRFAGAEEEFLRAHEHYKKGNNKEAVADALKAFESTMKTICDARKWPYPPGATAKQLIKVLFDKSLIPVFTQNYMSGLITVLEAGLPTVRNKTSGHGQGSSPTPVPDHLAAYALHLAAANIVLLVEAHKALP
jgi:hypothetical protein